jgi:hypothetical protein
MPLHSSIRINRDKKSIELCRVTCFGILVFLLLPVVATDANQVDTIWTKDDTKSVQLLVPVPMGIAVMSQLLVSSSVARDFAIDTIAQEKIPLLIHPKSFRTTLVQIVNESYEAFMLAHINMEKIQLQMAQVPDYVKECDKIIKTNNKAAIDNFVQRRLEIIKKAAVDGENLSKEVSEAFLHLGELIEQVLLAITASQGAKEKEIEDAIKKQIEADIKKQFEEDNKRRMQDKEREKANAMALLQQAQESLLKERERTRNIFEFVFYSGEKQKTIDQIEKTVKEAEKRLEKANLEAEQTGQDDIFNDFIQRLENMRVNVDDKISKDKMIEQLKEGTRLLGELQKNWAGMTMYFTSINSYIKKVMNPQQNVFIDDANAVLKLDSSFVNLLTNSMAKSLESSIKSQHTAATYVQVSHNYIMGPLKQMHGMLALRPDEMEEVQEELIKSCKNANEGIIVMFQLPSNQMLESINSNCQQGPLTYYVPRFFPFFNPLLPLCHTP